MDSIQRITVTMSVAGQDAIIDAIREANGMTYKFGADGDYHIAKRARERARDIGFKKAGKVPKLGPPEVRKDDEGNLVLRYPIAGHFA